MYLFVVLRHDPWYRDLMSDLPRGSADGIKLSSANSATPFLNKSRVFHKPCSEIKEEAAIQVQNFEKACNSGWVLGKNETKDCTLKWAVFRSAERSCHNRKKHVLRQFGPKYICSERDDTDFSVCACYSNPYLRNNFFHTSQSGVKLMNSLARCLS